MDTRNIINNSFSIMRHNKLRTGLTMLGIIIGISAVIIVSSVGKGQTVIVKKETRELSRNAFIVNFDSSSRNYNVTDKTWLTLKELYQLAQNPNIEGLSPWYGMAIAGLVFLNNGKLRASSSTATTKYGGICGGYIKAKNYKLLYGDTFTEGERRNFVIIDERLALKLFNTKSAVGKVLRVNYNGFFLKFNIVGIIKNPYYQLNKISSNLRENYFVFVPMQWVFDSGGDNVPVKIFVSFKDNVNTGLALADLLNSICNLKKIPEGIYMGHPELLTGSRILKSIETIKMYIISIASIILFVGGIGVMIMMILVINERKSEIGLRKALGAKNRDIVFQFLLESILLSFSGGIVGIVVGIAGCFVAGAICYIPPVIDWNMVLISILFSISIGIIFGIYPAYKAAKLEAIETLKELE